MKTKWAAFLAVPLLVVGGLFALRQSATKSPVVNLAQTLADYTYGPPSVENYIRDAAFAGEVRILAVKRRGLYRGYDEASNTLLLDEHSDLFEGDVVKLRNEDIRRDDVITEYDAEVVSVIAGELKPGDRIVFRRNGYAPVTPQGIEENAKQGFPAEVVGDQFLYLLFKGRDGAYGGQFRFIRSGDQLKLAQRGQPELMDIDGTVVTASRFENLAQNYLGKGNPTPPPLLSPLPMPQYQDGGREPAAPAKPVE